VNLVFKEQQVLESKELLVSEVPLGLRDKLVFKEQQVLESKELLVSRVYKD
jgi:hypothetical protein